MKVLKHKKNGHLYEKCHWSEPCIEGTIKVYPLGGGFVGTINCDDLEEVEMPTNIVVGWATIDGDNYAYRCTYNPVVKWNGWDEPVFHRFVLDRIARNWQMKIVEVEDDGFYMVVEDQYHEEGICLIQNEDGTWSMDGVCWTCFPDGDQDFEDFCREYDLTRVTGDDSH